MLIVVGFVGWQFFLSSRTARFGNEERYNFVLVQNSPIFVSLDRRTNSAVLVYLSGNLYVPTAEGYGNYRLKSVYDLGVLDKKDGRVLEETVEDFLGVPVAGYLKLPVPVRSVGDISFLGNLAKIKEIKTDLSLTDLGKISSVWLSVPKDKLKFLSLSEMGVLSDLVLADGTVAQSADSDKLDYLLSGDFEESDLRNEDLKTEVLNAGDTSGLGAAAARILNNIGIRVVSVANEDLPTKGCEVRADDKLLSSKTVTRIAGAFGCAVLPKTAGGRADVTLILRYLHPGG